ncbi:MAG TPA: CotH kinase family protein [Candidatus Limnocylindria bacterium]|nr:CotH kinase family protein [Candidatus Limnocylindria bacterium]
MNTARTLLLSSVCLCLSLLRLLAGEALWNASHQPFYPHSGTEVKITVDGPSDGQDTEPSLEYQVVEPGAYVGKMDAGYSKNWKPISLTKGTHASQWNATIPAEAQHNRRLVRYRVVSKVGGLRLAPDAEDSVPNFAYFVYDGVPAWRGAINPKGAGGDRQVAEFTAEAMRRVQSYHILAARSSVEDSTWKQPTSFGDSDGRKEYRWYGTLVSDDGTVYDHIRFRARGGAWRHAMGKNMWKIDFNKAHKFQARDDYGVPYPAKWSKLNLGACIQQADYGMRGEQGLFESVGFRLFNAANVPGPMTHWIQFRVVDETEETPADQYHGDFWGLYLAVENLDGSFLKDHGLPSQSVFKMESMRAEIAADGEDGLNEADAVRFEIEVRQQPKSEDWWRKTVDLENYYSYRSILECIHHYDLDSGKNYDYRRNPTPKTWAVVPWDIDLTWSDNMYGSGREPFIAGGLLRYPSVRREYQNRLREIIDLLYNDDQTGNLIDTYASIVAARNVKLSLAEADRRHWDWHPVMSSRWVIGSKSRPGSFYEASPTGDFWGMTAVMKDYVRSRRQFLESKILGAQPIPPTPRIVKSGTGKSADSGICLASEGSPAADARFQWRLAETTLKRVENGRADKQPVLEIEAVWSENGKSTCQIPAKYILAGHSYRARARQVDAQGNAGHWSEPILVKLP